MADNVKINQGIPEPIQTDDWKKRGFNTKLQREAVDLSKTGYIAGINFDALLDEMLFNRMLRLKNLSKEPQGNEAGKMYWDSTNKKYKIWVDSTVKWADVNYTTTSTSTTSTSTSTT